MKSAMKHGGRVLGVAAIVTAGIVLTACSSNGGTPAPNPSSSSTDAPIGPATVTMTMLTSNQPGMDPLIERYNAENTDQITVEVSYFESGDAFNTAIPAQFSSGNGTDIIQVLGGRASPVSVNSFNNAGYLTDQTDAPWVAAMYEPTKPLFEVDGKVLAKDFGISPLAIMTYNEDIFDANNLKVPTTFNDLVKLCGSISALGLTPISWGGASYAVNANNVAVIAGNTVFSSDPEWLAEAMAGDATFADSGWVDALDQLQQMIDAGCFSPGTAGMALNDMLTTFGSGQAAMMFTYGGLNGRVLAQAPDLNIAMFPFPALKPADTRITVQSAGGLGVSTLSKNQAAANAFLDWLSQPDVAAELAASNFLISTPEANSAELPEIYSGLTDAFKTGDTIIADVTAQWPATSFNTAFGTSIQGLFTGQKTVDQVIADADAAFADAIK